MALAVPQTAAVAVGAALVGLVDHRLLLLAMAALMGVAGAVLRPRGTRSPARSRPRAAALPRTTSTHPRR
jgi:hypothetical protein